VNLAIFDIDGTLTRPYSGEDASFLEGLELAFGFREVSSNWNEYPHVTDTGIVQSLFQSRLRRRPNPDEMSRFQELYSRAFLARVGPEDGLDVPGASGFITALKENPDWRVAMATGNCLRMAGIKLTRGGIPWREVPLANADDGESRADLVRLAIERARSRYGVNEFHQIVSVGDAPWDLRTARELQLPFLAIGQRCGHSSDGAHMIDDYQDERAALSALARARTW
jgi:phosphoglycolate phosphatase-like HAD superfamily hydrolase